MYIIKVQFKNTALQKEKQKSNDLIVIECIYNLVVSATQIDFKMTRIWSFYKSFLEQGLKEFNWNVPDILLLGVMGVGLKFNNLSGSSSKQYEYAVVST